MLNKALPIASTIILNSYLDFLYAHTSNFLMNGTTEKVSYAYLIQNVPCRPRFKKFRELFDTTMDTRMKLRSA